MPSEGSGELFQSADRKAAARAKWDELKADPEKWRLMVGGSRRLVQSTPDFDAWNAAVSQQLGAGFRYIPVAEQRALYQEAGGAVKPKVRLKSPATTAPVPPTPLPELDQPITKGEERPVSALPISGGSGAKPPLGEQLRTLRDAGLRKLGLQKVADPEPPVLNDYDAFGRIRSDTTRNLSQLAKASPRGELAVRRAFNARTTAEWMYRQARKGVIQATGRPFEDFLGALVESNLQGAADRWEDLARRVAALQPVDLKDDNLREVLGSLRKIEKAAGGELVQPALAMAQKGQLQGLRDYAAHAFAAASKTARAARVVASGGGLLAKMQANPGMPEALRIYKETLERPLAEAHTLNDGARLSYLGPLDTYMPLTAVDDETWEPLSKARPVSRLIPGKTPTNPANQFRTGLHDAYDVTGEALHDKVRSAMTANTRAHMWKVLQAEGLVTERSPQQAYQQIRQANLEGLSQEAQDAFAADPKKRTLEQKKLVATFQKTVTPKADEVQALVRQTGDYEFRGKLYKPAPDLIAGPQKTYVQSPSGATLHDKEELLRKAAEKDAIFARSRPPSKASQHKERMAEKAHARVGRATLEEARILRQRPFIQQPPVKSMPAWLWRELQPGVSPEGQTPNALQSLLSRPTSVAVFGPATALIHVRNLAGTMIANTPFLEQGLRTAVPGLKAERALELLIGAASSNPEATENLPTMVHLAQLGLIAPPRDEMLDYEQHTGLARQVLRFTTAGERLLRGPQGADNRTRVVLYNVLHQIHALAGMPPPSDHDIIDFVGQAGNYVHALQGTMQRRLGAMAPFFEGGKQMNLNAARSFVSVPGVDFVPGLRSLASPIPGSAGGPGAGDATGPGTEGMGAGQRTAFRLRQSISGGAVGLVGLWLGLSYLIRKKFPWQEGHPRMGMIEVPDNWRNSKLGKLIWGDDPTRHGYLDVFSPLSPLFARGGRVTGATYALNAHGQGASGAETALEATRGPINALMEPFAGPPVRLGMTPFGVEPSFQGWTDPTGAFHPHLYSAWRDPLRMDQAPGAVGHALGRSVNPLANVALDDTTPEGANRYLRGALALTGFSPFGPAIHDMSPAERLAHQYLLAGMSRGPFTPEQDAQHEQDQALLKKLRSGPEPSDFQQKAGSFRHSEQLRKRARLSNLESAVSSPHLDLLQTMKILQLASPEERAQLQAAFEQKMYGTPLPVVTKSGHVRTRPVSVGGMYRDDRISDATRASAEKMRDRFWPSTPAPATAAP